MSLLLLWQVSYPKHDKASVPNLVQARREPLQVMDDDEDLLLLWWAINEIKENPAS